jgi:RNA polymerase sigma-70 factor (sigma-E family)
MSGVAKEQLDEEFSAFVAATGRRWAHVARLLTRDATDAEDLVQQVLTRTYASWRRIRTTDVHAYVRRSLLNAYLDEHRRRKVLTFRPMSHHEEVLDTEVSGAGGGADDRDQLRRLLSTLTPRERAAVVLRYYLDASQAETAEVLGVSTGTVAATTSRALAKLRVDPEPPRRAGSPSTSPTTAPPTSPTTSRQETRA